MIILKNRYKNTTDIVIYENWISLSYKDFHIDQLDQVCQELHIKDELKQEILEKFQENQGRDNVDENVLELLNEHKNQRLNEIVAIATNNFDVLNEMSHSFDMHVRWRIANRQSLPYPILKRLSRDKHWKIRCEIAKREDLPLEIIEQLSKDKFHSVVEIITKRDDLQ